MLVSSLSRFDMGIVSRRGFVSSSLWGLPLWAQNAGALAEARAHENAGRDKQAVEAYRRAATLQPDSGDAWEGLVRSLIADRRAEEAYQALEEAKGKAPDSAALKVAEAHVLYRQGKLTASEKLYLEVISSGVAHPEAWLGLARMHSIVSRAASAESIAERAYRLMPGSPRARMFYADQLDDPAAHLAELEKALALLDPATEMARRVRAHVEADRQMGSRNSRVLESAYRNYDVKLELLHAGPTRVRGFAFDVILNGKKKVRLLLDTGASGISLRRNVAEKAGLTGLESTGRELRGIGDGKPISTYLYLAESVSIGELRFRDYVVHVSEKVADLDGLIGADVFEQFLVTFDFPKLKMSLSPYGGLSGAPSRDERVDAQPTPGFSRVFRIGNHLLLPTFINGKMATLFLIDSGANQNFISERAARQQTSVQSTSGRTSGVQGGLDKVFVADQVTLTFAGLRHDNPRMPSFDFTSLSDGFGTEISGLLGLPVLSQLRLTIDYRNGEVQMKYKD
ncbi:MAG: aspartyl protease family protein [Acidobacteriota bacterium]